MSQKKLLDEVVVVDIEATCWTREIPDGMVGEIIEVGVALLNPKSGEITESKGMLVTPEYSEISEFCTDLTTLISEQVLGEGVAFTIVCDALRKIYKTDRRVWASYGDYDRIQFERDCERKGVKSPFGRRHINVKTLFALVMGLDKEVGMADALSLMGEDLEGTHHRGVDDAHNIAKILRNIITTAQPALGSDFTS